MYKDESRTKVVSAGKMKVKGHMLAVCQSGSYAKKKIKKNAPNVKQHANYFTSL